MRSFIITALMAATALPVAAQAQSAGELRHDRREIQEQRRDLDRAYRSGDPDRIRAEHRDLRDARQEYREDIADRNRRFGRDDWRGWRDRNARLYAAGDWRAPFRYTAFRPGVRIAPNYYGTRYVIVDPWRYHLPPVRFGQTWVRHYNDVVLVDTRRGYVIDVIRGFYR
ncbi:RcnB family protein [Sphingomonas sp. NFR15]|uniref:RcnB family protein n=1 Tax=Sphingomonas sp. NFR15 TaxID=1566282 RepID=UPI000882075E|nr:RcnB family protein [Sphingomonas sp. NFR15]SDA33399.1 regulator RcnB of Ni and Co efflux [Sphingomonas sp. NFR15]